MMHDYERRKQITRGMQPSWDTFKRKAIVLPISQKYERKRWESKIKHQEI